VKPAAHAVCFVVLFIPSFAFAQDFSGFRIPDHHVTSWTGTLTSDASHSASNGFLGTSRSGFLAGALSTSGFWLHDSDPRMTFVSVQMSADGGRSHGEEFFQSPSIQTTERKASERRTSELWQVRVDDRRYPWAAPLGFELVAGFTGSYRQDWASDRIESGLTDLAGTHETVGETSREEWRYAHAAFGSLAIGYGRVRDATSVYDAWVLEHRLRESGALARPLSPEARHKLSQLLAVRDDYGSILERPARSIWLEVERLLREDGALSTAGLTPYAVQRAGETSFGKGSTFEGLPRSPVARTIGTFAGPSVVTRHDRNVTRSDVEIFLQSTDNGIPNPPSRTRGSARVDDSFDEVLVGGQIEHHRPLDARLQADVQSSVLFPVRSGTDGLLLASSADLVAIVTDRWLASAGVNHQRSLRQEGDLTREDYWAVMYGVGLLWYLEDHLALRLSADARQASSGSSYGRDERVSLGLTYRFLGTLVAPGLVQPIATPLSISPGP